MYVCIYIYIYNIYTHTHTNISNIAIALFPIHQILVNKVEILKRRTSNKRRRTFGYP